MTGGRHDRAMGRPVVTSTANPRVRAVARLRDRGAREEQGLTLIDGVREVGRALAAGVEIVEAFVSEGLAARDGGGDLLDALDAARIPLQPLSTSALAKVAFGARDEGIVAVARPPERPLATLRLPADPIVAVVEAVEKPGNLGAIVRSADGAGVDALIAADPATDLFNPNAIRASLGTIFSVPLASGSSPEILRWLVGRGLRPVAARVDAPTLYTDTDLTGPVAIVLGSEAHGLTPAWDDPHVVRVRIPMAGSADSLNVSVAAAVLLYEARRQRGWRSA
jgi:TrmH family RNA methyltransferase